MLDHRRFHGLLAVILRRVAQVIRFPIDDVEPSVVWKGADDDGSLYTTVFDQNQEGTGIYFLWPW